MNGQPAVYLLANRPDETIYAGVTGDLPRRIWQHKQRFVSSFCTKYNVDKLVYYELFDDMYHAIEREKQIKGGSRRAKVRLIESTNPDWRDLYSTIL